MKHLQVKKGQTFRMDQDALNEALFKVLKMWERRAANLGYNPRSKEGRTLLTEFLMGAVAVLEVCSDSEESQIPPVIFFKISRGEQIIADDFKPNNG